MTEQNAQLAHVAFQRPDGSTGVMDIHDEHAIPNEPDVIDSENLVSGAVINGKVAPDAITEVELADGAVTKDKLSPEMQEDWDSLYQKVGFCQIGNMWYNEAYKTITLIVNRGNDEIRLDFAGQYTELPPS